MDLLLSLLTAVGGAFLGTMAAFLSERWLRRSDAKRVEAAALNNLITDLHLRRALTPITPVKSYAEPNEDREFATKAILQIRGISEIHDWHYDQSLQRSSGHWFACHLPVTPILRTTRIDLRTTSSSCMHFASPSQT